MADVKVRVFPVRGADSRLYGRGMPHDDGVGKAMYWPYRGFDGRLYARGRDKDGKLFKAFPYRSTDGRLMFRSMREGSLPPCTAQCGDPSILTQTSWKVGLWRFNASQDGVHEITLQPGSGCVWTGGPVTLRLLSGGGYEVEVAGYGTKFTGGPPYVGASYNPVNTNYNGRVQILGSCLGPNYAWQPLTCDHYCGSCLLKTSYTICLQQLAHRLINGSHILVLDGDCRWSKRLSYPPYAVDMVMTHDGAKFILTVSSTNVYADGCAQPTAIFHSPRSECWRQANIKTSDNPNYPMVFTRQAGIGSAKIIADSCGWSQSLPPGSLPCDAAIMCADPTLHRPTTVNLFVNGYHFLSFGDWAFPVSATLSLPYRGQSCSTSGCNWDYYLLNTPITIGGEQMYLHAFTQLTFFSEGLRRYITWLTVTGSSVGSLEQARIATTHAGNLITSEETSCGCKAMYGQYSKTITDGYPIQAERGSLTIQYRDPVG